MLRIDKFLCDTGQGTRSEVKKDIRKGLISVNNTVIKDCAYKVDERKDVISYRDAIISYNPYTYIMLNKPQNVVSATKDETDDTVLSLLKGIHIKNLFPVGRLDKNTEGLLLITNDGQLAHELLSPKKHVVKCYEATLKYALSSEDIFKLEKGVDIGDSKPTLPAKINCLNDYVVHISIMEGRYHQVKRMFQAIGNEVVALKRLTMGTLKLDEMLLPGEFRYLTEHEINSLKSRKPMIDEYDAIIFDVDGTLVDSMWMWKEIDKEYLEKHGHVLPSNLQTEIEGMSFYETAVYFKERFSLEESIEEIMSDWNQMARNKYQNEIPLKEGVFDFIKHCKERNKLLGIGTSNSRELLTALLKSHNLYDKISCIKTGSEVLHGKPAPDIYLLVAEELKCPVHKCLVFEDIPAGIQAGKAAGMDVCAVQDAYSLDSDIQKHLLSDFYIESFKQLLE